MVLPYGVGMPANKRPVPQDAATARQILIGGLAQDADIFGIVSELAPLHPYALFAAIAYIRAAADRADVPVRQVCQELPQRG
jgi:hypothetical protein